jgi:5-methylcytosine-specific restriction endonuclease McrA
MAHRRSVEMQLVAYALARCGSTAAGGGKALPPTWLGTTNWGRAYDLFYRALGDGRSAETFRNSLKNARDAFDAHVRASPRVGWVDHEAGGAPYRADKGVRATLDAWEKRSDDELRDAVLTILGGGGLDLEPEPEEATLRTEGGQKVYVAKKYERDGKARAEALRIHGTSCMGCGFNFGRAYGPHGDGYIEVHHSMLLAAHGKRETDPRTDLVVLCSNCHRMVHRRRDVCLSLDELRAKLGVI